MSDPIEVLSVSEVARAARVFEQRGIADGHGPLIEAIKVDAARLHARIDRISIPPDNREVGRLVALAKTSVEEAVMWAVKAVSRFNPSPSLPTEGADQTVPR